MDICTGTSGYSYGDWVGPVYMEGTKKSDFFSRYTQLFNFVELNYSYYSFPAARTLKALQEKAPEGFRFALKAHQSMTHEQADNLPDICDRFTGVLSPLREAGSLASVLLQFPFSFHYTKENRLRLDALCRGLEKVPVHVEFRNTEWFQQKTIDQLTSRGVGIVTSDYPPLQGLPAFILHGENPVTYVRFHGRNKESWWSGTNVSRYDYLYSKEELEECIPVLKEAAIKSKVLLVAFNNHYKGKAVQNGRELAGLLEE